MPRSTYNSTSKVRHIAPKEMFNINRGRLNAKEAFQREIALEGEVVRRAQWETQTEKAITKRISRERMEAAVKEHEDQLLARRRRLADLYNGELEGWHEEILSRVETTEDRKTKIREKAYALKARNEAARQAFVKECYDRRWNDANDDARLLNGRALVRYVTDARMEQIQEKKERKEKLSKDEEVFFEQIQRHVKKTEKQEAERDAKKEKLKEDTIATLESQIKMEEERRQRHRATVAKEDEEEMRFIAQEIKKEKDKLEARKQEAHERGKEVRRFNETRYGIRQQKKEEELKQDIGLLDYALAKERKEEAAENAKRGKAKYESIAYQNYLKELMIKEAQDETGISSIRKKQEDEVWEKRDKVQRKQKEARDRLMKQVHQGRQEQMRLKAIADQEDSKLQAIQVARWREDIAKGLEEDRQKVEARRKAVIANNEILKRQMEERRHRAQLEKQQEYLAYKHMQKEEEEHVKRQKEQAGIVRLNYPISSFKWAS